VHCSQADALGLTHFVASSGGGYIVGGMPALPEVGKAASNRREFEMLRKNAISQYRGMMAKKRGEKGMVSIGQL
jgi:hypothetical protein